jgi:hypothetical protein
VRREPAPDAPRQRLTTLTPGVRRLARRAFAPFDAAAELSPHERWRVAALWAGIGGLFACVWLGAFTVALPWLHSGRALAVAALTILGAAVFFGAAGYLMVGIGNRMVHRHTDGQRSRPPTRGSLTSE